jgi:hypothetical protein
MLWRILLVILLAWPASAQTILQSGPIAPGRTPMYVGIVGQSQAVLQDSGPASGGDVGVGLSELGLTVQGTGTPPYANAGSGPYGANLCDYDAPITNPTGYHYICLSPNSLGGESVVAGFGGTATPLPLQFIVNGVIVPFAVGTVTSVSLVAGVNVSLTGTCSGTGTIDCTINASGGGGGAGGQLGATTSGGGSGAGWFVGGSATGASGSAGANGGASGGTGGTGVNPVNTFGGAGGAGSSAAGVAAPGGAAAGGGPGGASGGGLSSTSGTNSGGTGGASYANGVVVNGPSGGAANTNGNPGVNPSTPTCEAMAGTAGAGGGSAATTTVAGNGGYGGYGAGGGGGGDAVNGTGSAAGWGGRGGDGYVYIIEFF